MLTIISLAIAASLATAQTPAPGRTAAAWPFELTNEDMLRVDLTAIEWARLSTFTGGWHANVRYNAPDPTAGECRAVAIIAAARLRNRYLQQRGVEPVTLRVDFGCGSAFDGALRYDGVNTFLDVRDLATRRPAYRGRRRGLPTIGG